MKKYIIAAIAVAGLFTTACGGNSTGNIGNSNSAESTNTNPDADSIPADISRNPDYQKGLSLIVKNDCLSCHQISRHSVGPSYHEVANRYDGGDTAIVNALAESVIHGSSGKWGTLQMSSHPNLSLSDAKQMVKYILLLKTK